jgi:glycosyltransferase involved in cell wall biosynthesis
MGSARVTPPRTILGISFDGFAISGIVIEMLNAAAALRGDRFRVLCDLGYDVTLGRTPDLGWGYLPAWAQPVRVLGDTHPAGYTHEAVEAARARVVAGTPVAEAAEYREVCRALRAALAETFARENVRILLVENGTLPDNPLFTEALAGAIAEYGQARGLGKFVLWRDHDLMWSSEPHLHGAYPYRGVRRPAPGEHVHHAVTTDWMRRRLLAWAPGITCHVVPCRFTPPPAAPSRSLRAVYGIPEDALLVARCTRVAPQKSIERDLRLLHQVQLRLAAAGDPRKLFLVVAGPTGEDPEEFRRLCALERELSIAGQVVWADGLLPMALPSLDPARRNGRFTVGDLLAEAELSSFLTTFDYEGFGMPPGEAMVMGVPYIATTYEVYADLYGTRGAVAPLLPIDAASSPADPIPDFFVDWTVRVLTDAGYREEIVRHNRAVVQRFFSMDALERQLRELFADALR